MSAVKNVVAAIRQKNVVIGAHAESWMGSYLIQPFRSCLPAKWNNLNRYDGVAPKLVDHLPFISDDDHARTRNRHNLLAQQIASTALDQVEGSGFDFVRAVDGYVDCGVFFKRRQWNVEESGLMGGLLRRRDTYNSQPFFYASSDCRHGKRCCSSGTQPDNHPILQLCRGGISSSFLEPVYSRGIV